MKQLKNPIENDNYAVWSDYCVGHLSEIIKACIDTGDNKIFIYTNLKRGLPLENINKVAGPFVEAWAQEKFEAISENPNNEFTLINVQSGARLDPYDIILQFRKKSGVITTNVDVKATSEDIATSGKSPNITSYGRIRTEYVNDPDYIFVVLSLKHKVYGERDMESGMTNGIMEIVSYNAFDLKYVSDKDISYNPALGTGQLQIRDINYVTLEKRNTQDFCNLLDRKFIHSKNETEFEKIATKLGWFDGTVSPDDPVEVI